MSGHIFNIQDDGQLIEMDEQSFDSEDVFQELLAKYPSLLAGEQMDSQSPRRWLLIRREIGIAGEEASSDRWSLDHLFIDQDAIPTLVEVKRSTDTRLRREVVGQVLDYAANAVVHWSLEKIQSEFERQCDEDGVDPEERIQFFISGEENELAEEDEATDFWRKVKTNLQAGKVRLLIVADVIPNELRRIVEFLNAQMDPAEVLAVEIKHYVGQGLKTLVPRVIGQTAEAETRKGSAGKVIRKRPRSEADLQQIADDQGVGELYSILVTKIRPHFETVNTTLSNIAFNSKIEGFKSTATVLTLTPSHSTKERGIRFGVYVDRIAKRFNLAREQVIAAIPECDVKNPNWSDGYRQGFAPPATGLDKLIELIKSAN